MINDAFVNSDQISFYLCNLLVVFFFIPAYCNVNSIQKLSDPQSIKQIIQNMSTLH